MSWQGQYRQDLRLINHARCYERRPRGNCRGGDEREMTPHIPTGHTAQIFLGLLATPYRWPPRFAPAAPPRSYFWDLLVYIFRALQRLLYIHEVHRPRSRRRVLVARSSLTPTLNWHELTESSKRTRFHKYVRHKQVYESVAEVC
jgi:hypothetical protein